MLHLSLVKRIVFIAMVFFIYSSCRKEIDQRAKQQEIAAAVNNDINGHLKQTKTFSSAVVQKWLDMQLRNLRLPAGPNIFGLNGHRYFGYSAIALYESVVPGMPGYQSLHGQLTDMPEMPVTEPGEAYHWPTCANAALAYMNKNFFTTNVSSMDSLENALNQEYQSDPGVDAAEFTRSVNFGKTVAQRIFDWSKTDGASTVYLPYIPLGPGFWAPTPPNFPAPLGPYWGNNRLMVQGSLTGTESPAPPVYSTDPNSAYFAMVKEVYDVSLTLTADQIATGLYFKDNPGYASGTHYIHIFSDIMREDRKSVV